MASLDKQVRPKNKERKQIHVNKAFIDEPTSDDSWVVIEEKQPELKQNDSKKHKRKGKSTSTKMGRDTSSPQHTNEIRSAEVKTKPRLKLSSAVKQSLENNLAHSDKVKSSEQIKHREDDSSLSLSDGRKVLPREHRKERYLAKPTGKHTKQAIEESDKIKENIDDRSTTITKKDGRNGSLDASDSRLSIEKETAYNKSKPNAPQAKPRKSKLQRQFATVTSLSTDDYTSSDNDYGYRKGKRVPAENARKQIKHHVTFEEDYDNATSTKSDEPLKQPHGGSKPKATKIKSQPSFDGNASSSDDPTRKPKVIEDTQTKEFVKNQIEMLKKTFKYFDKSGKGVITRMDLRNILRHLGMNPTEDEIEDMINNYDENESGKLEEEEFLHLMTHKLQLVDTEDEVKKVFEMFDRDGSGFIEANELRMMFSFVFSGGVNEPTVAEMEEIMDELDKDGDGKLNLSEFLGMLME